MTHEIPSRRRFIKQSGMGLAAISTGTLGLTAKAFAGIPGSNGRLNVAMLGCSRRFPGLLDGVAAYPGARVSHVCEVNADKLEKGAAYVEGKCGYRPKTVKDLRRIMDDGDVDAVFVALPDHWHAHATWFALQSGKHVYVEKPCSHNPRESEYFIEWQNRYKKIIQMGNQQRSSLESMEAIRAIHDGEIGEAYLATAYYSNNRGPLAEPQATAVPEWLDWDLFQGPAPRRKYLDIIHDYDWHWFWHWGTAETGNNATHELDIARWALQVRYPEQVHAQTGKYHYRDDAWTMYDTMDATFRFPGNKVIKWDGKSRNSFKTYGAGRGTIIYGTEGSIHMDRGGYLLYDRDGELVRENRSDGTETGTALGGSGNLTTSHVRNFFEAIHGNEELHSPINEGAYSTQLCHYANISSRENDALYGVDTKTGHIKDRKLMDKYWSREYEPGWELKA